MVRKLLLKAFNQHASRWLVLFIDVVLACFSFVLAYGIRFDIGFNFDTKALLIQLPYIAIASGLCFWIVGSNRGIIRHTGTRDAFNVFLGVSVFSLVTFFIFSVNSAFKIIPEFTIPLSIIMIHYFVLIFVLVVSRYIFKSFYEIISSELSEVVNVMIYGAGDSGLITYGALNRDTKNNYEIVGFIDDDKNKIGKKIDQIKIYDRREVTKEFIKRKLIKEVIFSIQNIKPERLVYLTDKVIMMGLEAKIVPPLSKWIGGHFEANQIKQVKIEDLLDRKPISINNPIVQREVEGKTILVTGAAGSIGSEIVRQISSYNHKYLIIVDQAESPIYDLQQELKRKGVKNFMPIVADIRNKSAIDKIFSKFKPNKVFHAAAYKHVPLMEETPCEAVRINVCGTKNIADLSVKHKVSRFVMVSTDKAVNPTNVMGATKRVAEMYISCLSHDKHNTKFTTTRFGNVLGSNGSVIPLFRKQIEEGGPLTVTHKEITRFFMTIPEACRLVLEAGTMGVGGEIYIFDMGKSVKIFDIAKRMIFLSGFKYPEDIDIKITGLRPGEKLYEELLSDGENTTPTYHKKIMIAKNQEIDFITVKKKIESLCIENEKLDNLHTVKLIKEIVPEYISKNSIYEKLDKLPTNKIKKVL